MKSYFKTLRIVRFLICLFIFLPVWRAAHAQQKPALRDIYFKKEAATLLFGNNKLELAVDATTGNLLYLRLHGKTPMVQSGNTPATNAMVNNRPVLQKNTATCVGYFTKTQRQAVSLHVTQASSKTKNRLTTTYILYPGKAVAARVINIASGEDTLQQLHGFLFSLPQLRIGNSSDCIVNVPGPFWPSTFTPAGMSYDSLKNKTVSYHSAPDGSFGIFSITNQPLQQTITAFLKTDGDAAYHTAAKGDSSAVTLEQHNTRAVYLKPGERVASDTQQLVVTKTFAEATHAYRNMVKSRMPPARQTPDWIREAVILEILPDYFKDGFKEITAKLPFYKNTGFNTIYLMPHWKGGYSPVDLYTVNEKYGGKEDLQNLVQTAHRLGMHVLFDMVIHGFNTASPVVRQHPEFFYRDRNDTLMIHPSWGSVMTDFMNGAYRQYMKDYVLYDQKTFGMDGYRVDAASYKGPNWNKRVSYPAYKSGTTSPQLMKLMLDALRQKTKNATLLSEVFGPVFYTVSNFAHDNQTEALSFLLKEIEGGRYHLSQYKTHLQYVYGCLPQGAVRVFYTRNHDTSCFYEFYGYTPLFLTLEAIHAFFGVPEVFAGDAAYTFNPDDDPATYGYYKNLFAARRQYPEFIHGKKVFDGVTCTEKDVFAAMAEDSKHRSVFVASAAAQATKVALTSPASFAKSNPVATDIIRQTSVPVAKTKNGLVLTLEPNQIVVIRFVK